MGYREEDLENGSLATLLDLLGLAVKDLEFLRYCAKTTQLRSAIDFETFDTELGA